MSDVPSDLRYTRDHEWVRLDGDEAVVGITDHAQEQLGELVYVEVPDVGARLAAGETAAEVESVKSFAEVYAPVAGEVVAVNEALEQTPELINDDPYGEGWIVRLRAAEELPGDLLDAEAYRAHVASEEG